MIETITNHLAFIDAKARLRGADDVPHLDELNRELNHALSDTRWAIVEAIAGLIDPDRVRQAEAALENAEEYTAVLARLDRVLETTARLPARTMGAQGPALAAMIAHRREVVHDLARATTALYVYTRGDA